MKKEVSPALLVVAIVLVVGIIVFAFWRSSVPPGVKTEKPPKPNPPGAGAPAVVE